MACPFSVWLLPSEGVKNAAAAEIIVLGRGDCKTALDLPSSAIAGELNWRPRIPWNAGSLNARWLKRFCAFPSASVPCTAGGIFSAMSMTILANVFWPEELFLLLDERAHSNTGVSGLQCY
jgi:hypothetical protein